MRLLHFGGESRPKYFLFCNTGFMFYLIYKQEFILANSTDHETLTPSRTVAAPTKTTSPATDSSLAGTGQDQSNDTDDSFTQHESTGANNDQQGGLAIFACPVGDVSSDETSQRERWGVEEPDGERNTGWNVRNPSWRS